VFRVIVGIISFQRNAQSCEQRWFNLLVDIQAQQDAPTQDKVKLFVYNKFKNN
jgi:hypothetical protein